MQCECSLPKAPNCFPRRIALAQLCCKVPFFAQKHLFLQHAKLPRRTIYCFSSSAARSVRAAAIIGLSGPCFLPEPTSPTVWHFCVFIPSLGAPRWGVVTPAAHESCPNDPVLFVCRSAKCILNPNNLFHYWVSETRSVTRPQERMAKAAGVQPLVGAHVWQQCGPLHTSSSCPRVIKIELSLLEVLHVTAVQLWPLHSAQHALRHLRQREATKQRRSCTGSVLLLLLLCLL